MGKCKKASRAVLSGKVLRASTQPKNSPKGKLKATAVTPTLRLKKIASHSAGVKLENNLSLHFGRFYKSRLSGGL